MDILRMILACLPTVSYGAKAPGSQPISIGDDIWAPRPTRRPVEIAHHAVIADLEARVRMHGLESLEGLTPEMIDLEADLNWREALGEIPSREELMLMSAEAQAPNDAMNLAIRYLDPPRNAAAS